MSPAGFWCSDGVEPQSGPPELPLEPPSSPELPLLFEPVLPPEALPLLEPVLLPELPPVLEPVMLPELLPPLAPLLAAEPPALPVTRPVPPQATADTPHSATVSV